MFSPAPSEELILKGNRYSVLEHPSAAGLAYCSEGTTARVFKLRSQVGHTHALKVFNSVRSSDVVEHTSFLWNLRNLPGLLAADRQLILPDDPIAKTYPDLSSAIIMPWIKGVSCFELFVATAESHERLSLQEAKSICSALLATVSQLEQRSLRHTDISSSNVFVRRDLHKIELIDIDDMVEVGIADTLIFGASIGVGTDGYRHPSPSISVECDRYATAILAAEIILLSDLESVAHFHGEGFFRGHRDDSDSSKRFTTMKPVLQKLAPNLFEHVQEAWLSPAPGDCPSVRELLSALAKDIELHPSPGPDDEMRMQTTIRDYKGMLLRDAYKGGYFDSAPDPATHPDMSEPVAEDILRRPQSAPNEFDVSESSKNVLNESSDAGASSETTVLLRRRRLLLVIILLLLAVSIFEGVKIWALQNLEDVKIRQLEEEVNSSSRHSVNSDGVSGQIPNMLSLPAEAVIHIDAIVRLTEALREPSAFNYNARGREYLELRLYAEAVKDFDHAIQLDPSLPLPYLYRGAAKRGGGDEVGSRADEAKALRLLRTWRRGR